MCHLIFGLAHEIHNHSSSGLQVGELRWLVVVGDLGFVAKLNVDIAFRRLNV